MFDALSEKMRGLITRLAGQKRLTEENISEAVSEVRLALLDADVNYTVVKGLIKRIKEKAVGEALIHSVTPGQQFIKIVHDELVALMGGSEAPLHLERKPAIIMLCGLQGSGKTTQCAKLARYLKKKGLSKKPLLVACDLQRPAAVVQLCKLGEQVQVPVFTVTGQTDPVKVAKEALVMAKRDDHDVIIVDTAGRLHLDEPLMEQLEQLKSLLQPSEILFVANATTGQDAVNTAAAFDKRVAITGTILTMLDGNAKGGAAISIREVTGKPLKFEGVGEKPDDLRPFHPGSMADRILAMGDTINLVRAAQEHIDETEAKRMEQKIREASFTYEDYLAQIQTFRKMGPLKTLLGMMPGLGSLSSMINDMDHEKALKKTEAVICSMTPQERREECELTQFRCKRIARGSGQPLDEVLRLRKSFKQAKQFFKDRPNQKLMEKMMGGFQWH